MPTLAMQNFLAHCCILTTSGHSHPLLKITLSRQDFSGSSKITSGLPVIQPRRWPIEWSGYESPQIPADSWINNLEAAQTSAIMTGLVRPPRYSGYEMQNQEKLPDGEYTVAVNFESDMFLLAQGILD